MHKKLIAKVYVENAVYAIDKPYDYLIPDELCESLKKGCRVLVPFGRANKKSQGFVYDIYSTNTIPKQLKEIYLQLDKTPIITDDMLHIIEFLVKNTFCTYYDAIKCVLPTGKNVYVTQMYKLDREITAKEYDSLTEPQKRLVEFLKSAKTQKELNSFLGYDKNPIKKAVVSSLIEKGIVSVEEKARQKLLDKTVKMVCLEKDFDKGNIRLTSKQKDVVNFLEDTNTASVKEVLYMCGVTEAVLANLEKKNIIRFYKREVESEEIFFEQNALSNFEDTILSKAQQEVFLGIEELTLKNEANAALLYGITGSGKTQIYIKLIQSVINRGKTAILLVPEIALTPQLVEKFKLIFGSIAAAIHSNLSLSERQDVFNKINAGIIKIVIGTRSAVFAPLKNLGIIIMDEEGESSYKSDSTPRYHAKDIAKLICVKQNATLLLASATPSIDSFYQAKVGKYKLFTLKERYANAVLPDVYIVDMLAEQKNKNFSVLSDVLYNQIRINLENNEQTILLLNRRGYNTYAECIDCGEVQKCPNCDVSMTYHKANGNMMCHYCGHTQRFVSECSQCHGHNIKLTGTGTQKAEDEILSLFKDARILRMDADTTYSKDAYEKNFKDFKDQKYDIMLGTQMIAKGLDFENVTLVGVLNADSGLYSGDFKSSERVFSLITQVVGRSGRSKKAGRAYIQTMQKDNVIINYAANQDYESFYDDEIETRKLMLCPPFCDVLSLGFNCESEETAYNAASFAMTLLKKYSSNEQNIALKVLGISKAPVYKVSNKYRIRIIIKCKFNIKMRQLISKTLKEVSANREFSKVTCFADVNGDIG